MKYCTTAATEHTKIQMIGRICHTNFDVPTCWYAQSGYPLDCTIWMMASTTPRSPMSAKMRKIERPAISITAADLREARAAAVRFPTSAARAGGGVPHVGGGAALPAAARSAAAVRRLARAAPNRVAAVALHRAADSRNPGGGAP